jgi:hypothetical protein
MRHVILASLALLSTSSLTSAQRAPTTGFRAFAVEAAGATVGSAVGLGVVIAAVRDCDSDDTVRCALLPAAGALLAGTALSATGAIVSGRMNDTEPSVPGAILGAIAGAFAGIGVDHLLREELNTHHSRVTTVVTIALTQGITTALGSRAFAAARRSH